MFLVNIIKAYLFAGTEAFYFVILGAITGVGLAKLFYWLKDELGFGND
jgi:hypothetical protein